MNGGIGVIEGNIAAGKTYIGKKIGAGTGFEFFEEKDDAENPYLENFYEDPEKYGFLMQLWFLLERVETYDRAIDVANSGKVAILDRSVVGDAVFVGANTKLGKFSPTQVDIYNSLRNRIMQGVTPPTAVTYLATKTSTCMERIQTRGRACEKDIPESYLELIQDEYATVLVDYGDVGVPVLMLDWTNFGDQGDIISFIEKKVAGHSGKFEGKDVLADVACDISVFLAGEKLRLGVQ